MKTKHYTQPIFGNTLRRMMGLVVMMVMMGTTMAQTDPYVGTWYITNGSNYYLVPAAGYYQGNVDKPYITTFQTARDNNSIWRIESVNVSGDTYYRIIHNATGKYITAHDAVEGFAPHYLRMHLESFDSPTDATLFIIVTHTNGKYGIRSKDYDDAANNNYWFDITQGNQGNLWQDNGNGQLGFYYDYPITNNPNPEKAAPWTFQEATPVCATPVISYDNTEHTFSISCTTVGATIHYTTDGSEPTSFSTPYTTRIQESNVTKKLRAIAVKTGYTNSYEAMVYGTDYSATPHLFKTSDYKTESGTNIYYNFSYYLIPPVDDDDLNVDRNYLTTSNVPNARMQWLIKPATASSGVQYHYLVNAETGKYVYFTGIKLEQGNTFLLKERDEAGTEDDRFMFRIWEGSADGITYFNFAPKLFSGYPPSHKKGNFLCKQNNTNHNNPTGIYRDDNNYGRTRWQMIDVPAEPSTLSELPSAMVSDASNSVYFKLRCAAQTSSTDYFVYPPSSAAYATAATSGENPEWYFVEATDADTWNTYYNIRNAQTGDYLYFNSTTAYNDNGNKFLTSSGITSGNEDMYKFLVLNTANTTYSGTYHIVPKAIRNNNNQANIALNRDGTSLKTRNSRDNNASCWYLDAASFKCSVPTFQYSSGLLSISCSTADADIYYAIGTSEPEINDQNRYTVPFTLQEGQTTVTAIAVRNANGSDKSDPATFAMEIVHSGNNITNMNGYYTLADDFTEPNDPIGTAETPFRGTIDGQFNTFTLSHPLFNYVENAVIRNVIISSATIDAEGNVGAIVNNVQGDSRIYNCGVLSTSSTITGSENVGSIVGLLDGTSRVINCYSFATVSGGTMMGGIVGRNNQTSTMSNLKTIVMNCMFYGEISGAVPGKAYPVYGGNLIDNSGANAINNYNYYRGEASFDDGYTGLANYNRSWPAEEQNLRRFEYYRSILNSNRRLCAFWITDHTGTTQTAADTALVAKWVLDPSIAPYPILKKWGKYPSIINPDPLKVWDTENGQWTQRTDAAPYRGKKLGTSELSIKVKTGSYPSTIGLSEKTVTVTRVITDMDTLNYDYCYGKVQLPYYNEVFGDPTTTNHLTRYYGNYTDKAVTAWKITSVQTDGTITDYHSFVEDWETGYNYADRHCTAKDIYDSNGNRAFAQGGYYYVPEGVTEITIEAYWGNAFYLHGRDHSLDRVSVCSYDAPNRKNYGYAFTPAGTLPTTMPYNNISIYEDFSTLMAAVKVNKTCNVYDQAVVLVGNYPLQARNDFGMGNDGDKGGFTLMSADFDMDNEPDFIFPLQWRSNTERRPIMPIRFDFLPVPELGLVMRHNKYAYAIGIFVPQGHFEITETSFMHTTQFEYMSNNNGSNTNHQKALILNGGEFEQFVSHGTGSGTPPTNAKTRNIIMGGHVWMNRFTPGSHSGQHAITRHCSVSVMGGEFPEFYLTGLYWSGVTTSNAFDDNPHCYINGGRFGIMAGAGMEAVKNSVFFEIDHAVIDEFYGGGINANNPVVGNINVIINNSLVHSKYCGGPKVGKSQTVITKANGSVFNYFYGGGNGGTNLYREQIQDQTPSDMPNENTWNSTYGYGNFKPISIQGADATYNASYGYHAEFEFEVFNQSNGINANAVARSYRHWAQFGTTETGNVTSVLTGCTVKNNFYGGGNLGNVSGSIESILTDCVLQSNVFGGGFSATIPHFPVHDREKVTYPYRDAAGVCHNGSVGYRTDESDAIVQYTWCYKNSTTNVVSPAGVVIPSGVTTSKPAFQYDGKWYCYTTVSLEGLGAVSNNATLTLKGSTTVGTLEGETLVEGTGNVYGGGDESAVTGNTTVILEGGAHVLGNVYGGGNRGAVGGDSKVEIKDARNTGN